MIKDEIAMDYKKELKKRISADYEKRVKQWMAADLSADRRRRGDYRRAVDP